MKEKSARTGRPLKTTRVISTFGQWHQEPMPHPRSLLGAIEGTIQRIAISHAQNGIFAVRAQETLPGVAIVQQTFVGVVFFAFFAFFALVTAILGAVPLPVFTRPVPTRISPTSTFFLFFLTVLWARPLLPHLTGPISTVLVSTLWVDAAFA